MFRAWQAIALLASFSAALSGRLNCLSGIANGSDTNLPLNYGIVLFPGFEPLDVNGPLDVFSTLSRLYQINISLIAEKTEVLSSAPPPPIPIAHSSNAWSWMAPQYNFTTAPKNLDVLIIPGGAGTRATNLNTTIDYIRTTFPSLKYFMTVCTGAMLAAKAGLLDGKNATTNKAAWNTVVATGPKTNWIGHARWVQDGNIWTGAGVSAGIDTATAFVSCYFGYAVARNVSNLMEYKWVDDANDDPFAAIFNVSSS